MVRRSKRLYGSANAITESPSLVPAMGSPGQINMRSSSS
jgi:hypothetical protein